MAENYSNPDLHVFVTYSAWWADMLVLQQAHDELHASVGGLIHYTLHNIVPSVLNHGAYLKSLGFLLCYLNLATS